MKYLFLLVLIKISLIIYLVYVATVSNINVINSYENLIDNYIIVQNVESLFSTCKDAETGQRGYILTGDDKYLVPFNIAYNNLKHEQQIVDNNDVISTDKMASLRKLIADKLDELQRTIDLRKNGQYEEALKIIKTDYGQEKMDKIRELMNQIISHQQDILSEKRKITLETANYNNKLICIAGSVMFLTILANIFVFYTDYRQSQSLFTRTEDLTRSNHELEQFAYVASHDLQEPLRMVASYCKLLERKYFNILDANGKEFIHYAVDGATRMQLLINDLLTYSRVRSKVKAYDNVDLNICYQIALENLKASIQESQVVINCDKLPIIYGDKTQMTQVLQNLIANAIKFRTKDKIPTINIKCILKKYKWQISVEDNGIGIEDKFKNSLFVIFKRLNNKSDYPGTGIGLALCKNIIERHGGKIWFESEFNVGTKFYFILGEHCENG